MSEETENKNYILYAPDLNYESRDWYYDLYWIIIRQVRRRRDKRYMFTYPNTSPLPDIYYKCYDTNNCNLETHIWTLYWTKIDEKTFIARNMIEKFKFQFIN